MNYLRLALVCGFVSTTALCQERNFDAILQGINDAAVPAINWSFEKTREYPQVPGIIIAGMMRAGAQAVTKKAPSFVLWGLVGSTVFAEACKITATNYLYLQKNHGERRIKENWLHDLKAAKDTAVKSATGFFNEETKKNSDEEKLD